MKKVILIALLIFSATALQAQWGSFNGVITTNPITDIDFTTAVGNGTIALDASDPAATTRGFVWNTTGNPTTADDLVSESGSWKNTTYNLTLTGLTPNKLYYVRAYIINTDGTQYGNQVAFSTIPTLGEWGMIAMGTLLLGFGGWFVYRRMI